MSFGPPPHLLLATLFSLATGGRRTLPAPRADFLVPDNLDYHNVATLGPSPRQVVDATMKAVLELESNPTNEYFGGNGVVEPATLRMEAVREKAAKALGAFLNETLVMPSTTVSLNNVAEGLVSSGFVKRGDFVLTTDQEHAGGLRCWQHYTKVEPLLGGLDVVSIPVSPPPSSEDDVLQLFREALEKKQYRVVTVSHVTTTNGLRLPLRELADLVHQHGAVLVVDGAQAHGGIRVDVHELGVDVYTTSSHKWLCAPKGAGLLFISQRVRDRITPTFLDGGSYPYTGSTGTRPQHTLAGLGAAIDYFESFGFEEVEAYNLRLRSVAYAGFSALAKEIPGITLVSPPGGALAAPILTVGLPANVTSIDVSAALYTDFGQVVKITGRAIYPEEGGPSMPLQATRFSFHLFNNETEVKALVKSFGSVVRNLTGAY